MSYKWDLDDINNEKDKYLKDLLKKESKNKISSIDPSKSIKLNSFKYKKTFEEYLYYLSQISTYLYEKTYELPRKYLDKQMKFYEFDNQGFTEDITIEIVRKFINETKDEHLIKEFEKLINKNDHLLNISEYNPNIPLCNYLKGRCITQNNKSYVSIYIKHNIEDLLLLIHEFGHFHTHSLNKGEICNIFLKEFESFFLELLMINYIENMKEDTEIVNYIKSNKITSIQSDIIGFTYSDIAARYFFKKNIRFLTKATENIYNTTIDYHPSIYDIYTYDFIDDTKRIHSKLFAYEIFNQTKDDLDKSIYTYKKILEDKNKFFDEFAKTYNIYEDNYLDGFNNEYTKVKKLIK